MKAKKKSDLIHRSRLTVHRLVFTLFICLIGHSVLSQSIQNHHWFFPNKFVSFLPGPQITNYFSDPSGVRYEGYNSMQDANNDILFYIDGGVIVDASGVLIDNFNNNYLAGRYVSGYPENCIIPVPESCSRYYIVAADASIFGNFNGHNPSLFYVTLDMALPNVDPVAPVGSIGALVGPNSTELFSGSFSENHSDAMHLAATRLRSSNDRFIFSVAIQISID